MLQVKKDNTGLQQGFFMKFQNGYQISVQFGSGNYCLNSLKLLDIAYIQTLEANNYGRVSDDNSRT